MLDLFTIFTKGGIVLWCFRSTNELFAPPVNALIRNVLMQASESFFFIITRLNLINAIYLDKEEGFAKSCFNNFLYHF